MWDSVWEAIHGNPVRTYLYGVVSVVLIALVSYGVIEDAEAGLWAIVAATVLGVPVAVETARSKVTPTYKITKED